jgi:hypothetical protein
MPAAFALAMPSSWALAAQVRLELREHAKHVEKALACRRAGVDGLLGGLERRTTSANAQ